MNIYVGNLNHDTTEDSIRTLFETYGDVNSVKIIKNWDTGRSRGFGFVEMPVYDEAKAAISELHGTDLDGRKLVINKARPKRDRRDDDRSYGRNRR